MSDEAPATTGRARLVARIVATYVAHHTVQASELARLVATTRRALDELSDVVRATC